MLDLNYVQDNLESVKKALTKKHFPLADLEKLLKIHLERNELIKKSDDLKAEQNRLSKEIPKASTEKKAELLKKSSEIKDQLKKSGPELDELIEQMNTILFVIPNLPDQSVPEGKDEHANKEISCWGKLPKIDNPQDHVELGTNLDILDLDRAAKISGTRFSVLKGMGAKLERALAAFMLDQHTKTGYQEIIPPYLVNAESLFGTGQLPKFEEDLFQVPHDGKKLYLIPTAEVPVTNYYRDEILDEKNLPVRFCSLTPCFRSEAGSYGKDTKGIIRQHQFHKVELVCFSSPEKAEAELETLTSHAEAILQALKLPYRKILLCGGDMGFSSAKTYDLEVWIPSQNTYREISSCSWFTDFQARRAQIRYRGASTANKIHFVHTLNGSGLAVGRTWVAVIENYQQADGSIAIPEVLQPYLGGQKLIGKS